MKTYFHNYCFIIGLLTLLISSCAKESGFVPQVSSKPLTDAGGTPVVPATNDYQPFDTGSTWRYQDSLESSLDTTTNILTGKTNVIDAKTFYEMAESNRTGKDTSYYYKGEHNYISNTKGFADGVGTELLYLNDNEAVGYTWNGQAVADNPLVIGTYKGTILEKDISKTVLGKNYTNVIHTQVVLTLTILGTAGDLTCDFYTAKGIGIIEMDTDDGTEKTTSKLIDYVIK